MYNSKAHIHFVGIGGIGMSGIAQILKNQGYTISGCDADFDQQSIKDLKAAGCIIFEGNNNPANAMNANPDILVYSSAIERITLKLLPHKRVEFLLLPAQLCLQNSCALNIALQSLELMVKQLPHHLFRTF